MLLGLSQTDGLSVLFRLHHGLGSLA
jgi:hypothetical protein